MKKLYILGNGDSAQLMPQSIRFEREGKLIVCNLPPFEVGNVYAACVGDFKMMAALTEGSVNLDGYQWVLANRPQIWMNSNPSFYIKHSHHIREFYTHVPSYCDLGDPSLAATNFNCGHLAAHYSAERHQPDEIHMFGFDSIFDANMRSYTDIVLSSDRAPSNNYKLLDNWRPIWNGIFKEFPNITFYLYHTHSNAKINLPKNVKVMVSRDKKNT
jgi:hypothetical protein